MHWPFAPCLGSLELPCRCNTHTIHHTIAPLSTTIQIISYPLPLSVGTSHTVGEGSRGDRNTANSPEHTSSITSCIRIHQRHETLSMNVSYPVIDISLKIVHKDVENCTQKIRISLSGSSAVVLTRTPIPSCLSGSPKKLRTFPAETPSARAPCQHLRGPLEPQHSKHS